MLYLIRFDVRSQNDLSLSKLRKAWQRGAAAAQGSHDSGITQSFKVVGQQTIFAVAEFPNNEALDEGLARLPIVEDLGSTVEIEVIPVRSLGNPVALLQTPDTTEGPVKSEEPDEQSAVPEEPTAQPEAGQVTGAIRRLDQSKQKPVEQEETPEQERPTRPEEVGKVTGMIQNLGTPGYAPVEPGQMAGHQETGEKPVSAAPEAPASPRVLLQSESHEEIVVESDLVHLGRCSDNQVVVDDPKASRHHALIQRKEGTYWIDDLGSQNGTRVNENLVSERCALKNGDVIRIGDTRLMFGIATESVRQALTKPEDPSITGMIRRLEDAAKAAQPEDKPAD